MRETLNMDKFLGIRRGIREFLRGTCGFIHFVIKVNNYCNLHCEHCTNNCDVPLNPRNDNIFRREKWELPIEDLVTFCERFKGIGESNFHHLTGGEVTMMPIGKVEEIIEVLDSYKRKMSIQTSAYNLVEIDKSSINKIALIKLADHGINSEHIEDSRRYLKTFYKGEIKNETMKSHWELTVAMRHPINRGKKCRFWMRNPLIFGSIIYPCCNTPFIMLKNNNTVMREELIKAGWSVYNDDITETMRNWRSTIPKYVIDQCENNCWRPRISVGQGKTKITLKSYDIIRKGRKI